jgi:hypothetical protein
MKILLLFEKDFPADKNRLLAFLHQHLSHLTFELYKEEFEFEENVLNYPESFGVVHETIKHFKPNFDRCLCFTTTPYDDNWFLHGDGYLTILSFFGWGHLTNLPHSNGIIYFIVRHLALNLDPSRFGHSNNTGCIYDSLGDKRGIDDGMRQARFCSSCLQRISAIGEGEQANVFNDLKLLMNLLSEASRWNKDILATIVPEDSALTKRKAKSNLGIQVVIASPGDTSVERKILLDSLERKFRIDNHEAHCGFRIIANGWEDLASQNGYTQDVINKMIIANSDFVITVFKHRLGTPTRNLETGIERAPSGTAEELLQTLDKSKKNQPIGMVYFYSKAPIISLDSPDKNAIEKEWMRLSNFKKSIQDKIILKPYTEADELLNIVLKDLENNILEYIER